MFYSHVVCHSRISATWIMSPFSQPAWSYNGAPQPLHPSMKLCRQRLVERPRCNISDDVVNGPLLHRACGIGCKLSCFYHTRSSCRSVSSHLVSCRLGTLVSFDAEQHPYQFLAARKASHQRCLVSSLDGRVIARATVDDFNTFICGEVTRTLRKVLVLGNGQGQEHKDES